MFVAVGRIPERAEALATAARLANLALADAGRVLTGTLPRVLLRASPEAGAIVTALDAAGFVAWTGEPAEVPTDAQRILVRSLTWDPAASGPRMAWAPSTPAPPPPGACCSAARAPTRPRTSPGPRKPGSTWAGPC